MTQIFHITHIDNLPGIIQQEGIWSDAERIKRSFAVRAISYSHIKERRLKRKVPVAVGGMLGDYVSFYFAPRSPMLYTTHMGNVANYQEGQGQIVHLVSKVDEPRKLGKPWAFTNLHAELGYAEYYDDWANKNEIDWEIIRSNNWGGDERRPKKMAEFLVHQFFPWESILGIGVINQSMAGKVSELLVSSVHKPKVSVNPMWYY